ncbi:DUF3068 domain-containing protein [soil metagenome]
MRRVTSTVLIGLGTFLIMIAIMTRFYAYQTLAVVPDVYESTTNLQAKDATIFDADTLAPIQTDLNISSHTYTNPNDNPPDGQTDWVNATSITRADVPGATCDPSVNAALPGCFKQDTERVPFDVVTGAASTAEECPSCTSTYDTSEIVDGKYVPKAVPVTRTGQIYKMPFNVQKKDYAWWDSSIQEAPLMKYVGEEKVNGLNAYKFVQTIEPTNIGTQDLPGSVFGVDDATVTADMMYAMTRTLWIEPATGSPVKRVEDRNQVFSYNGTTVAAFVGQVTYTDAQVDSLVKDGKSQGFLLGGMRMLFPLLLILIGVASIAGGFVLRRPRTKGTHKPVALKKDQDLTNA